MEYSAIKKDAQKYTKTHKTLHFCVSRGENADVGVLLENRAFGIGNVVFFGADVVFFRRIRVPNWWNSGLFEIGKGWGRKKVVFCGVLLCFRSSVSVAGSVLLRQPPQQYICQG